MLASVAVIAVGLLFLGKPADRAPNRAASYPFTFSDDSGVTVTVTSAPKRVVTVGPHLTEILFEIEAGKLVVGVAAGETYPAEATALPEILGADGFTPDPEKIKSLAPDLVIASGGADPWKSSVSQLGTMIISFEATTLEDATRDIRQIGRIVGKPSQASRLAGRIIAEAKRVELPPEAAKPTVFFETFADPLTGAAPQSFIGDLVAVSGGKAVPDSADLYPTVTLEQLRKLQPAIYIAAASTGLSPEQIQKRRGFGEIPAVKENRVYVIDDEIIFRPGPRLIQGLVALRGMIQGNVPASPPVSPSG